MNDYKPIALLTVRERRGIILLLLLVIILTGFYLFMPLLVTGHQYDYSDFEKQIDAYELKNSRSPDAIEPMFVNAFDINEVTVSELIKYGLKEEVALRWKKYRDVIGGFDSITQIRKIYGLDEHWYERYYEHFKIKKIKSPANNLESAISSDVVSNISKINLDENLPSPQRNDLTAYARNDYDISINVTGAGLDSIENIDGEKIEKNSNMASDMVAFRNIESPRIDINTSNIFQWQMLKGIGPFYAKRIVNFRDKLGGFSEIDQVGETHDLPDSVFQTIRPYLDLSPIPRPIAINRLPADSLRLHPYIGWKQANILENYRIQHGPYESADDLFKVKVFDSVFIERIRPYLSFAIE